MKTKQPCQISLRRSIASVAALWLTAMVAVSFAAQSTPDATVGETMIDLDTAKLFAVDQRNAKLELNIAPERVLTLSHERVLQGSDGARTWVGQAKAVSGDFSAGTAYITELQGHVYGTVSTGETTYEIVGRPGETAVVRDLAAKGLQIKISLRNDAVIPPVLGPRIEELPLSADRRKVMPAPQVTIDLMIVYTTAFTTRHGAGAGVTTRLNNLVAQANDSYLRSEVGITLRLVRAEETAYTNSNNNQIALTDITNGNGVFGSTPSARNTYGADLVALVRPYDDAAHNGCGLAWIGGYQQTSLLSQYGYAVISEGSDVGGSGVFCLDKSFQHELGHNMGLMHDRAQVVLENNGGALTYGATSYAFGYVIPGSSPTVGDIMSYPVRSVNCFSSPNVYRQGPGSNLSGGPCNVTPTTGDVLGVAAANAESSADAASALNFTRKSVAAFRAAAKVSISGTVLNGAIPLSNIQFCARPSAGVVCPPTNNAGAYSCTVPTDWGGTLHAAGPAGLRIKPQVFTIVGVSLSAQNPVVQAIGSCNLDVDNNGLIEPATDGVAIIRRMMGFDSGAFSGLAGTCAANATNISIFNASNPALSNYNVTGGAATRAATDGAVIVRVMNGAKTDAAVTGGLGLANEPGATNTTWSQIQSWLNSTCGSNF